MILRQNQKDSFSSSFEQLEKDFSVIHVAGTKGKGSVCAFSESILRHCGYKTGLYTSPHLVSVRERIRIDGLPIHSDLFTKYFWIVWDKLQKGRVRSCQINIGTIEWVVISFNRIQHGLICLVIFAF